MPEIICPPRDQLAAFALGDLDDALIEAVADHLDICAACETTVTRLEGESDTFVARFRSPVEMAAFSDEPEFRQAVARIGQEPAAGAADSADASPTAADNLLAPEFRDYQLLARLGSGGMGTVYKARHTKLQRIVALKTLPLHRRDAVAVSRFTREMEAVGKLNHPNIVRAFDAGESEDTHFLVMEYIQGVNLHELVNEVGPLPFADACEIIRQAALGLQHAHEYGLVHRDVKPSNIMLDMGQVFNLPQSNGHQAPGRLPTCPAVNPTVKVLDLGLARLHSETMRRDELTDSGQVMGTLDYMAPEQADDSRQVDARADIYALGCTLYKLLTGTAPFAGEEFDTPAIKIRAHLQGTPPRVEEQRADMPAEAADLLARMLAKSRDDRPATASEVAGRLAPLTVGHDLRALMAKIPIVSEQDQPPASAGERAVPAGRASYGKQQRDWRRRSMAPVAAILLAALLVATVVITIRVGNDGTVVVQVDEATGSGTPNKQPAAQATGPRAELPAGLPAAVATGPPTGQPAVRPEARTSEDGVSRDQLQGQDQGHDQRLDPPLVAAISDADREAWLTSGLPPLIDANKTPPFEIVKLTLKRNHIDQEIMEVDCRRSWVISVLAVEVKLVILPSAGGRYAFYAPERMTISPRPASGFMAVGDYLLDFRGEIPGGARVYLELRSGISFREKNPPVRISKVFWFGSDEQLAAAVRQGPPPRMDSGKSTSPPTAPLSDGLDLPLGTPVRFQANGRTRPARIAGPAPDKTRVSLLVYFAYPKSLYVPYLIEASRGQIRIETGIETELTQRPDSQTFARFAETFQNRLSGADVPHRLVPAGARPIEAGQRLVLLANGDLSPLIATGPAEDVVVVVTGPRGQSKSRKRLADLYVDPTPVP